MSLSTRVAIAGAQAYARTDRALAQLRAGLGGLIGGALAHGLDSTELADVTAALYRLAGPVNEIGLFPWEQQWFETSLPAPPARILLGGAGYGREGAALQARGYDIVAFEPEPAAARRCDERLARPSHAVTAGYSDLTSAVAGAGPLAKVVGDRFDAVVFGWGSFGHLLRSEQRESALVAANAVTDGPILVSFMAPPPTPGRAHDSGARLGQWLRRLRDRASPDWSPPAPWFAPWCGFLARIEGSEVDRVAASLARSATWNTSGAYLHATLRRAAR